MLLAMPDILMNVKVVREPVDAAIQGGVSCVFSPVKSEATAVAVQPPEAFPVSSATVTVPSSATAGPSPTVVPMVAVVGSWMLSDPPSRLNVTGVSAVLAWAARGAACP